MKEKLSLLTELIRLASSDKTIREREYDFMLAISERLGISRAEYDKLFTANIEFTPPKSEFDRILQFHRLVLLMNIDQEAHRKELQILRDLGIRMGLSPLATEKVLTEMHNYEHKLIPAERLVAIFREQYN
jgi:hypothetical protein